MRKQHSQICGVSWCVESKNKFTVYQLTVRPLKADIHRLTPVLASADAAGRLIVTPEHVDCGKGSKLGRSLGRMRIADATPTVV